MQIVETIRLSSIVVGIASAVIGGAFAINGYLNDLDKRIDDRKKQTLQLVNLFYSQELVRARATVLQHDRDIICDLQTFVQSPLGVSLYTHVEFFDIVQTCIESNLCDAETAREFFAPYANWHWPALRQHIEAVRRQEASFKMRHAYGYGLETLAANPAIRRADCLKQER